MPESIRKSARVEVAQETKVVEPKKETKKEVPKKELPLWNFPLQGRSVRASSLAEAKKIINNKK
jgi:hypothetical protein